MVNFLILVIIIIVKAFFAGSETAFTYLNKAKFNQMSKKANKKKEKRINNLLNNKLSIFGTTRVGITFAELLASAFAAEAFLGNMEEKLETFGLSNSLAYVIALVVITIILSYFTLVFGELLPKRIARNNPEKVAYKTVNALVVFSKINYGFEKFLTASENLFSKIFGIKNEPNEKLTEKEIKMIISEGKEQGIFDEDEKKLLYNALKFDDFKIKDIIVEKEKVTFINSEYSKEKILEIIKRYKYTRFPVYSGTKDNIIGVLNIKDIIINNENDDIKQFIREPLFVSGKDNIDEIFKSMQLNNKHIAIVKNAEGKVEGMITMEDIIEKLLGNILDEFDS